MKPRIADWFSIVGLVIAVFVFDGRLLGGGLPRGEDHWLAFIPAYSIGEGHWPPRWNPYVCGGMPHAANPQYSAWYPPRWAFYFTTALAAYGPYCFSHFLIAALAMFVCLRSLGCGPAGTTIGALSFSCGSYIQGHLSNPGLLFSSVWLPLIIACSFRTVERAGLWWPSLLGLLLAVVVFAGSPHNMFYAALIVGLVAVWKIVVLRGTGILPVADHRQDGSPSFHGQDARATLGHIGLAVAIALGLGAVQWIPTAEFVRLSFRPHLSVGELARDPLAWSWLDNLFLGSPSPWATEYLDKSTYFGMSVLPLLLLAIVAPQRRGREWFFVFLALAGVWIALGTQAGAFQLLGRIPPVRFLSGPSRALVLFALGMSALAGFGADSFLRRDDWEKQWTVRFVLSACAAFAAILFLSKCWQMSWQDMVSMAVRATTPRDPSLFLAINSAVFVGLGVLLLASAGLLPARLLSKRWFGPAAALLLCLDLLHFRQRLPLPVSEREELTIPETAAVVRRDKSPPFRVVGYEPTRLHPGDMNDQNLREFLMPNLSALYGLQDIQGFDPLILRDFVRLVVATAGRSPIDDPVRMLNFARPDSTLFRLLNVRYVVGDVRERRIASWPPAQNDLYTIPLDKPTTLVGISLVTLLDRAQEIGDGTTVGIVTALGERQTTGNMTIPPTSRRQDACATSCSAAIRAGIHTADWRATDERFFCRHRAARENMAWSLLTPSGPVHVANYYAQVVFDRPIVARTIEIRQTVPGIVFSLAMVAAILPEPTGWEGIDAGTIHELLPPNERYRIYRNREALGGAWLVHQVRRVRDENEALDLLAKGDVNIAREAVVAEQSNPGFKFQIADFKLPADADSASTLPDRVEFVRYEADRIEVRTESPQPAVLCFAELFYPGWIARLDGKLAEVVRVNFLLRGVIVPTSGHHTVTLHFAPRSLLLGKTISAVSLLVALGVLIASGRSFWISGFKLMRRAGETQTEARGRGAE